MASGKPKKEFLKIDPIEELLKAVGIIDGHQKTVT
jgi:hypothetical protein